MKKRTSVLEFWAMLCIFSVFLDKAIRGAFVFDFYYYYPIFLIFLIVMLIKKGHIVMPPRWFNWGIFTIFITGFGVLMYRDMLGFEYVKQVFGILFTSFVSYNVLYVFRFDIVRIFNYYLRFAYWVALFGVFDNILHIAGIHITTNLSSGGLLHREFSIMGEPFYLAVALAPAVVYNMIYFQEAWAKNRNRFLVIMICFLITYSSIAVTGLVAGFILALHINNFFSLKKNRLALVPIIVIPAFLLINQLIENVSLLNVRFNDTYELFFSSEMQPDKAGESNASTFALYSNFIVSRDSFFKNPLFGSGLGAHPLIYRETFLEYFPSVYLKRYGAQNQQDANSKFLRLLSETGLTGLLLFLFAYFKFFASKRKMVTPGLKRLGAINYSIAVYILLCLIRNGNYVNIGFFLFFFIYYVTWKQIQTRYQQQLSAARQPIYAE